MQPHANFNEEGTMVSSLEGQLLIRQNIATTYAIYDRLVHMVKDGLLDDYDIIIDEVSEVVRMVTSKSKTSTQKFYISIFYSLS